MTNQQTETKPFRSLADVYREKGLCECGCGRRGHSLVNWHDEYGRVFLSQDHQLGEDAVSAVKRNRSTPAPETGGAKPVYAIGMRVVRSDGDLPGVGTIVDQGCAPSTWMVVLPGTNNGHATQWHERFMSPAPEEQGAKTFDFGPFTREDWDWLLGEARKQDPEAVVFRYFADIGAFLTADRSGHGTALSEVDIRNRLYLDASVPNAQELAAARRERRIYPDDCPEARARWGSKPVEESADNRWLRQTVARLMRLQLSEVTVRKLPLSEKLVVEWGTGLQRCQLLVCADTAFSRNAALVEDGLRECGLINSPAGVGSVSVEARPCATEPTGHEPTPAEATTWGIPRVEPVTRKLCREDVYCVCVYCRQRRVENAGHKQAPEQPAARQRLALMDQREKPRDTRWSLDLERAHPWSNDDD